MLGGSSFRRAIGPRGVVSVFCLLCAVAALLAQPEGKRVTFYTAQTSYSLPVLERNGIDYVGLFEALEPIGPVSAKPDDKKWKLKLHDGEAQFETGRTKAKIRGKTVELTAPFLFENGRGYVPVASLKAVVGALISAPVDVHQDSRRVFIGVTPVKVTAKKTDSGTVAFTFSAPVNPQIATEPGRLRMTFLREPLVSDASSMVFDDKTVTRAAYAESNGAAEIAVNASAPLQASFSEDRRTITVSALTAPAAPQQTGQAQAPALAGSAPAAQSALPKPRPRPSVLIDAAHGGDDSGAMLAEKVSEKDVTLALARRLKHELELRGVETELLRDSDSTLSLDQRVAAINGSGAALYVAIHANASGTGLHLYTALLPPQQRRSLAFVRAASAQAPAVETSREIAASITTELLKRDLSVISMPASVPPLNLVLPAAIAVELAPPGSRTGNDLASPGYQQSSASALAAAIASARNRLLRQEAMR